MNKVYYLIDRLKEPTSWAGIAIVASIFGGEVSAEFQGLISDFFSTVAGLILFLWKRDTQSLPRSKTPIKPAP